MTRLRHSKRERAHFAFLHKLQCVVTGVRRPLQAAHVRYADAAFSKPLAGVSAKPDPWWALPLSVEEHQIQHNMRERTYWLERGLDPDVPALSPLALALDLWRWSEANDVDAAMRAIDLHRANVSSTAVEKIAMLVREINTKPPTVTRVIGGKRRGPGPKNGGQPIQSRGFDKTMKRTLDGRTLRREG